MSQVTLRRLLERGDRPDVVVIECLPMTLSRRDGTSFEEQQGYVGRFTAAEVVRLWPYRNRRLELVRRWVVARLAPGYIHQVELRNEMGIDQPPVLPRYR